MSSAAQAITSGFFYNAAQLQKNGNYRTVKNPQTVHMHPSSGLADVSTVHWRVSYTLTSSAENWISMTTLLC